MSARPHPASFLPSDEDVLVAASLACPWCLSAEVDWRLETDEYDDRADCECNACERPFVVYLVPEQALRLALATSTAAPAGP